MRLNTLVAIVFSVAALEAFINELADIAGDTVKSAEELNQAAEHFMWARRLPTHGDFQTAVAIPRAGENAPQNVDKFPAVGYTQIR